MLKRVWKISHKLTKQSAINIGALLAIESIAINLVVCRVLAAMSANPFVRICFVIAWLCLAKG